MLSIGTLMHGVPQYTVGYDPQSRIASNSVEPGEHGVKFTAGAEALSAVCRPGRAGSYAEGEATASVS